MEPTLTERPATSTPEPVDTPTFTVTAESNTASISYWNDIPIVPGAKDGLEMDSSYMYSVNVTMDEAEQFYKENLEADGWALSIRETGPNTDGNVPLLLIFEKDQELIRILLMGTDNLSIMMERVKS